MRLSRIDLLPLLTIVAGGLVGGLVSFSFLASSPSGVPAPDPVVAPALTLEDRFEMEIESLENRLRRALEVAETYIRLAEGDQSEADLALAQYFGEVELTPEQWQRTLRSLGYIQ